MKCRAKDLNGNWVEGYHCKIGAKHYIIQHDAQMIEVYGKYTSCIYNMVEIDPKTLGMETGVPDKNEMIIYGSIPIDGIMSKGGDKTVSVNGTIYYIEWERGGLGFIGRFESGIVQLSYLYDIEIIGPACNAKE